MGLIGTDYWKFSLDLDSETLTVGSLTSGGNITLPDNKKILVGTGSDLEIYHDASHSYVVDNGTGGLYVRGSAFVNIGSTAGESYVSGVENGAVSLYHNDSTKLATSSTGVSVTGGLTATSDIVQLKGDSSGISHYLQNSTTGSGSTDGTQIYLGSDESFGIWNYENTYLNFATNNTERMRILATGNVGIGVVAPGSLFNIASAGGFMGIERFLAGDAAGPGVAFYKSRGSSQDSKTVVAENDILGQIWVYGADGSSWVPGGYMRWQVTDTPGASDMPASIEFGTTNNGQAAAGMAGFLNQVNVKFPGATTSTGNSANCQVDGNGRLHTSSSSKIYKTAIEDLEDNYADKIFLLEPKLYKSNAETVGDDTTKLKPDWSYYGLLAEDVEKIEPRLVAYKLTEDKQVDSGSKGEQGETIYKTVTSNLDTPVPMSVNYDRITAHLINVVKRFKTRIETLETSNADLIKRVEALESK